MGFDGSLNDDSTVLRGCCMSDGYRFTIGMWEKPASPAGIGWEVPRLEVLEKARWALRTYKVARSYWDPHEWRSDIDLLAKGVNPADDPQSIVIPWARSATSLWVLRSTGWLKQTCATARPSTRTTREGASTTKTPTW